MTAVVIATAVTLGGGLAVAVAAAVERSARAAAWRRIAEERRWNHDHRAGAA